MKQIRKVLIANRGEIAVRIIRTCRAMGIGTVAVYSDADAGSMHTLLADEAVHLGAPEPSASYLDAEKIIAAAKQTGADAIHPGYGFLSERDSFAEACVANGVIFIGPSASAMRKLGSKIDAKNLAVENDVPITPGFFQPGATADQLLKAAEEIGFPVMLKASAGGGGRGMRVVRDPSLFMEECALAADEALKGFGDDAMMVEKLVERPRHIELQLLADQHGNVAVLFERECSLQRRHQKVVEEAPSPYLSQNPEMWEAMRECAIRLAKGAGYSGAGTMEFMVDEAEGKFYFLEVNARLQVEHPVTEEIVGLDLVRLQIEIAEGKPLELPTELMSGDRKAIKGWSVEARIIAEDPAKGFLPSIGPIKAWVEPRHPGVRVDTGFRSGSEVSRYYDSLLAKVIATGPDRATAVARLREALRDLHILGVKTNTAFVLDVIADSDFQAGAMDTGFLGRKFGEWQPSVQNHLPELIALAESAAVATKSSSSGPSGPSLNWDAIDGWRNVRA